MLARPAPQVDVLILQAAVDNLRIDIDMILEARAPESEVPSVEPIEDTVMASLFATSEIPHLPLESVPRGVGVKRRLRLEHGRKSTVRWRLRGEPPLLMRRRIR